MLRTYTTAQKQALYNGYDAAIWLRHYYDDASGGYVVVHRQRLEHSRINKQEEQKFAKELSMCLVFARNGYCMELLEEVPRISSPDVRINGVLGDLKCLCGRNNILRRAKKATREQGADVVLFEIIEETSEIHAELLNLYNKYSITAFYCFAGNDRVFCNSR